MNDRLWILALVIAGLVTVFEGRLFQLQVVNGSHYAQLVEQSRLITELAAGGRHPDPGGDPDDPQKSDMAALAESDLLSDDPREALTREISLRWSRDVVLCTEPEFESACALIDQDFNRGDGRTPQPRG